MKGLIFSGAAAVLVLTGCGGSGGSGGGSGSEPHSARFVDNAVTGLHYICNQAQDPKTTGAQGGLECPQGATVRFLVGDIELGETVLNDNTLFITPANLADEGADETDNTVTNIGRFLISLDVDQNPDNGIQIDPASHQQLGLAIDFNQTPAAFTTAVASTLEMLTAGLPDGPFALVSPQRARDHLIVGLHLTNAGFYSGTVSYDDAAQTGMTFLATRQGAIYGVNQTKGGLYATSGFEEIDGTWLSTTGSGSDFMIDGSTGATYLVDVNMADGLASGGPDSGDYPRFEASRRVAFDPVYDKALVEEFADLLPLAIGIGEDNTAPFVFYREKEGGSLLGAPFGAREGGPPSAHPDNDQVFHTITLAEVVATEGRTLRILGMSLAGYVVDATIDLSGDQPTVHATWEHVHEDRQGETQRFVTVP